MVFDAAAADGDTQKLDPDTLFCGLSEDEYECTMPQDDTLQVYDDTEVLKEGPCLHGETQVVGEDLECGAWIETQVVGDWEETCTVDDGGGDEGSERTEVLSDDGSGLNDDGGTEGCTVECGNGVDCNKNSFSDSDCGVSNGDGSCDGSGSVKRSFASVRTASLRASGITAARNMTPTEIKNFVPDRSQSNKQDTSAQLENINKREHACLLEEKIGELCSNFGNHNIDKLRGNHGSKMKNNPRVRKLFDENEDVEKDDSARRASNSIPEEDSVHLLTGDDVLAGLTYIYSQEPGELSQANALNVVDNFLSISDVGLSQDVCLGKTSEVKLPHVASTKGVQCLAKAAQKSPVGKSGIFDWNNALENEGGGDFFTRKSSLFFNNKHATKLKGQQPKARHSSGSSWKKNINAETPTKAKKLCLSDSRIKTHHSVGSGNLKFSEATARNVEQIKEHLEDISFGMDTDGLHNVGPDTQLAAEAMKSLVYGSIGQDLVEAYPIGGNPTNDVNLHRLKKDSLEHAIVQKMPDSLVMTTSKTTKLFGPELGCRSLRSSNKQLKKLGIKSGFADRKTENTEPKVAGPTPKEKSGGTKRLYENNGASDILSNGDKPVKKSKSMRSVSARRTRQRESHSKIKNMGSSNERASNMVLLPRKELMLTDMSFTPVAHRTRKAEAAKPLGKGTVSSDNCGFGINEKISCQSVAPDCRLSGEKPDVEGHSFSFTSVQTKHHPETILNQLDTPEINVYQGIGNLRGHAKQRRKSLNFSGNSNSIAELGGPPSSSAVILGSSLPLPLPKHDDISNTVFNDDIIIEDPANRKSGDVAASLRLDGDKILSNGRNRLTTRGARTRSHVNSCRFISLAELRSIAYSNGKTSLFNNNQSASAIHEKSIPRESAQVSHGEDVCLHSKNKEENSKQHESIKEAVQSSATCLSPFKNMTEGSPVCIGMDPLKMQNKKHLSRTSLVKELRLESTKMVPISTLKEMRKRRDISGVRVLFSRHLDDDIVKQQKKILARLGTHAASSISDATHFVADKFVRTRNILEAMSVGKPVVTHLWLESCGQANCFLDEKNYILRDLKKEKEIGFSMPASLAHACHTPLLAGKRAFITPNAKPDRATLSSLVKACGGQPLERIGRSIAKIDNIPNDLLVISCEEDYTMCSSILEKGALVFDSELLLNGIVIQKLELERHRLFLDHVRTTRSTVWLRNANGGFLPVTKCK